MGMGRNMMKPTMSRRVGRVRTWRGRDYRGVRGQGAEQASRPAAQTDDKKVCREVLADDGEEHEEAGCTEVPLSPRAAEDDGRGHESGGGPAVRRDLDQEGGCL